MVMMWMALDFNFNSNTYSSPSIPHVIGISQLAMSFKKHEVNLVGQVKNAASKNVQTRGRRDINGLFVIHGLGQRLYIPTHRSGFYSPYGINIEYNLTTGSSSRQQLLLPGKMSIYCPPRSFANELTSGHIVSLLFYSVNIQVAALCTYVSQLSSTG